MARFALDEAAWSGPWRLRSTGEKALLSLGLLTVAATSRSLWVSLVVLAGFDGTFLQGFGNRFH